MSKKFCGSGLSGQSKQNDQIHSLSSIPLTKQEKKKEQASYHKEYTH